MGKEEGRCGIGGAHHERGEVLQRGWGCGLEGRAGRAGKWVWVGSAGKAGYGERGEVPLRGGGERGGAGWGAHGGASTFDPRGVSLSLSLCGLCSLSFWLLALALGQGGSGWQVGVGRVCGQAVWGTTRRCGYVQADELADEGAAYKRAAFERARGLRAYLRAVAGVEMDGDGPCRRVAKE